MDKAAALILPSILPASIGGLLRNDDTLMRGSHFARIQESPPAS